MFRNILNLLCRGRNRPASGQSRSSACPRLEELECRLTPSDIASWPPPAWPYATVTNASVQIIPNLASLTVTEKVTAMVSNAPSVPIGTTTPGAYGRGVVQINLNNQQQIFILNSDSQATATFTMPLFVFMTGQELTVFFAGGSRSPAGGLVYSQSYFNSPLYVNFDNFLLPANLSFTPVSSNQMLVFPPGVGTWVPYSGVNGETNWPPYTSVNGETDNFGLFAFQYADPGAITGIQLLGQQLPAIFAAALGAYGSEL